jgi:solute carrier family 25 uncoupling protein 27
MTMYETIREDVFGREEDGSFPLWKGILAGMSTGAIAQFFATPCDLVKVQMQIDGKRVLQGEPLRYKGTLDAYAQIWQRGGLRGMFQGWIPSCQRSALVQLGDLAAYDAAKQRIVVHVGDNMLCHALSSACAGLVAAFMSCPADVIKTRVMNQVSLLS